MLLSQTLRNLPVSPPVGSLITFFAALRVAFSFLRILSILFSIDSRLLLPQPTPPGSLLFLCLVAFSGVLLNNLGGVFIVTLLDSCGPVQFSPYFSQLGFYYGLEVLVESWRLLSCLRQRSFQVEFLVFLVRRFVRFRCFRW